MCFGTLACRSCWLHHPRQMAETAETFPQWTLRRCILLRKPVFGQQRTYPDRIESPHLVFVGAHPKTNSECLMVDRSRRSRTVVNQDPTKNGCVLFHVFPFKRNQQSSSPPAPKERHATPALALSHVLLSSLATGPSFWRASNWAAAP